MTKLLIGKPVTKEIYDRLDASIKKLIANGINPFLEILMVGNDPASEYYAQSVVKKAAKIGIKAHLCKIDEKVSEDELIEELNKFNNDPLELMRYIKEIMNKDFSLIDGMMPLGSCTMKINHPKYVTKINNSYLINKHPFSEDEQITNILKNKLENQEQIIYESQVLEYRVQLLLTSHQELDVQKQSARVL